MLKTTKAELGELLASSPEAMVIVDGDGQIVLFNKELVKLFGYPAKALTGMNLDILLPERFRNNHTNLLHHFFSKTAIRPMSTGLELYGCRKGGTEFPVEINLHPFETELGTPCLCCHKRR